MGSELQYTEPVQTPVEEVFQPKDLSGYGFSVKDVFAGEAKYFYKKRPTSPEIDESKLLEAKNLSAILDELSLVSSNSLDNLVFADVISQKEFYNDNPQFQTLLEEVQRVMKLGGRTIFAPLDISDEWDIRHVAETLSLVEQHNKGVCKIDFPRGSHSVGEIVVLTKKGKLASDVQNNQEAQRISHYALGDAMVYAYGYNDLGYDVNEKLVRGNIEMETRSQCDQNSLKVIRYMLEKYPNHFDRMFILESTSDTKVPFKQGFSRHSLFVLRDFSGRWYIGSPANYESDMEDKDKKDRLPNTLTEYYEGNTLSEAVKKYQQDYGGDWGDPDDVEDIKYVHPIKDPWIKIKASNHLSVVTRYICGSDDKYVLSTLVD